jgi:hypothetical protein
MSSRSVDFSAQYFKYTELILTSCKDLRNAVAICLQRSKCVMLDRNTPQKCLEDPELMKTLPEKCLLQYYEYLECRYVSDYGEV